VSQRGQPGTDRGAVRQLIAQLKSAPVAVDGVNAGECVDPKWESEHGHAHASVRYGAMSRPSPSPVPVELPEDPQAFRQLELARLIKANSYEERAQREPDRSRFVW